MTFLNPFVLLGLVAAGIPLIIHLFNFRRPRRIDFSSLAFVRELQKSTMQRVRLKQWLLLLLRTLAIAMLVVAFARPTLTGGVAALFGGTGRSSVAIIVDNSASMELRDSGGAYLNQAQALARAIADQLEPGDDAVVLTTAGVRRPPVSHQTSSSAAAAVNEIQLETHAAPARAAINEAAALLEGSQNVNKEIFFISDLQRRTLGDSLTLDVSDDVALMVLPIGSRAHANVSIDDVRVESRVVEAGAPVRLVATVRSYGGEPVSDYSISVYLGDERVAQAPVDLRPGVSSEVMLVVTPQEQGWLAGRVEGEDDTFPRDNVFFFTMNVPAQRHILLVGGAGAETRYLRLALDSREDSSASIFDVEEIPGSSLPTVLATLGEYDALVLAGASVASTGEIAAIEQYVARGGGVLITPGGAVDAEQLTRFLNGVGGGSVTGVAGERGGAQAVATFERVDAAHPVFEGIFSTDPDDAMMDVESPRVLAAIEYEPASGAEQTLIQLTNGRPFLQEIRHGRGVVLLLAVAPDPTWSDLPVRGLFVPLAYRSLQYLSASESVQGEEVQVGAPAELRLAGISGADPVRIVSPFGEERLPEQRALPGAVLLRLVDRLPVPGIYDVYEGQTRVRRIAANVDRTESDLQTMGAAELEDEFRQETDAAVQILDFSGDGVRDPGSVIGARRSGVELWNVCLLLALAFLVSEMIVARQWRPEAVAT